MKKVLLTVLLIGGGLLTLRSQTAKGAWAFGLHNFSPVTGTTLLAPTNGFGLAFGTSKSESATGSDSKSKYTSVGLGGNVQYFLIDHLSAGLQVNFLSQTEKEQSTSNPAKYTLTLFMAGPELRDYIPVGEKASIWIKAGAAFGTSQTKLDGNSEDDPTKLSRYGGGAGVALFLNPHISLDLGADYNAFIAKSTYTNFSGAKTESKDTMSGVTFDIGFTAFF